MKAMGLDWVLETIHDAVLEKGSSQVEITGVSIDSRKVRPGDLFFAFSGEHVDGHDYIEDAFQRGAAAAVISHPVDCQQDKPLIRVSDPLQALQALARGYRSPEASIMAGEFSITAAFTMACMNSKSLTLKAPTP